MGITFLHILLLTIIFHKFSDLFNFELEKCIDS